MEKKINIKIKELINIYAYIIDQKKKDRKTKEKLII